MEHLKITVKEIFVLDLIESE